MADKNVCAYADEDGSCIVCGQGLGDPSGCDGGICKCETDNTCTFFKTYLEVEEGDRDLAAEDREIDHERCVQDYGCDRECERNELCPIERDEIERQSEIDDNFCEPIDEEW